MISDIFEHTITVYNRRFNMIPQPGLPPGGGGAVIWMRTVISGVMWKDNKQTNQNTDGVSVLDKTISITIPKEADYGGRTYIEPSRFNGIPRDQLSMYWTVNTDPVNSDIIVLGEGREIGPLYTIDNLRRDLRHMSPRKVTDSSHVTDMPMIRIHGV